MVVPDPGLRLRCDLSYEIKAFQALMTIPLPVKMYFLFNFHLWPATYD